MHPKRIFWRKFCLRPRYMLECHLMTKQSWLSSSKIIAKPKLACAVTVLMIAEHLKLQIWVYLYLRLRLPSLHPSQVKFKIFQPLSRCWEKEELLWLLRLSTSNSLSYMRLSNSQAQQCFIRSPRTCQIINSSTSTWFCWSLSQSSWAAPMPMPNWHRISPPAP